MFTRRVPGAQKRLRQALQISAAALMVSLAPNTGLAALQDARPVIEREADIPRTDYTLPALPSVLVFETPEAMNPLRAQLKADVSAILSTYEIQDVATRQRLLVHLQRIAFAEGEWAAALDLIERIRDLEDADADKASVRFLEYAFAVAALSAGTSDPEDSAFQDAFRRALADQVAQIDYAMSETALRGAKNTAELLSPALLRGSLEGALDPNAEAQDLMVTRGTVSAVLGNQQLLQRVPLGAIISEVIGARIDSEQTEAVDLWTDRLADLSDATGLTPVTVGIWDSGTDLSLFGDRVWVNPHETINGRDDDGNGFVDDVNGIAFAPGWTRSTGVLRPVSQEDAQDLDQLLMLFKGRRDMAAGLDTQEAALFRQTISSLEADQVMPLQLQLSRFGIYAHGTTTADIAQRGNPAARLLPVRFDQEVRPVPAPFDEASAARFADYVSDSVEYLDAAGARVVNMSWRITTPQIERSLSSVEPDSDRRRERAIAIFETMNSALERAFAAKPDMLFIAGAGNEDEDVEFVRSMPAGINLPNVITVGAVDQALQPARFTSYGSSIDVYANGQQVLGRIPGGTPVALSGTSMAAPQVTNLAAKLWAISPELSVADVRGLIEAGSSMEGTRSIPVIHPAASLAQASR